MYLMVIGYILCNWLVALAGLYTVFIGGILSALTLYLGVNIANKSKLVSEKKPEEQVQDNEVT